MPDKEQPNNPTFNVPPERMDIAPADSHKSFFMRHLLAEVLGVVAAGAILAGGYFYYVSTTEAIPHTEIPVHKEQEWKTYANTEYGFEFKYLSKYNADSCGNENQIFLNPLCDSDKPVDFMLSFNEGEVSDSLNKYDNPGVVKVNYTIDGTAATEFNWTAGRNDFGREGSRVAVVFTKNGIIFDAYGFDKRLINQILSTFKFIEPTVQINSYASCVAAGNPISKSKPPKCTTTDGITFVEPVGACIQVIAEAKNPETDEVRMFPTPCDIPEGWEKVSS